MSVNKNSEKVRIWCVPFRFAITDASIAYQLSVIQCVSDDQDNTLCTYGQGSPQIQATLDKGFPGEGQDTVAVTL